MPKFPIRLAATCASLTLMTACGGGGGGGDGDGGNSDAPVKLRFQSLAWQDQSIKANKQIVEECNAQLDGIEAQYVQGDWGSVHDQLLTSFEGGDPPDVIHYESAAVQVFAEGGYLADLEPMLSDDFKSGIPEEIWATVEYDEQGTIGAPFLVESRLPIANATLLKEAGIEVPTPQSPWTWDDFQQAAEKLTDKDTYGVAWPLSSPANAVVTLSQNFGGKYVDETDEGPQITVGEPELAVPTRIHEMLYEDGSASPETVSVSTTDALPGFFENKYAMIFGATWLRQQMVEQAPDNFNWVTIPPLAGSEGQQQAVNPQILSVAAQSEHPEEATKFVECFLGDENMAELAQGDWLVPTSEGAREALSEMTGGEQGWDVAISAADELVAAPWRRTAGFQEWMDRFTTPTMQRYFADEITADELASQLEEGGEGLLSEGR